LSNTTEKLEKNSNLENQLNEATDKNESLSSQVEELSTKLSTAQGEITQLNSQISELNNTLLQRDNQVQELSNALSEKEKNLESASAHLQEVESELEELKPPEIGAGGFASDERITCPMCGAVGTDIKTVEDKHKVLSYVGHIPMYAKKHVCKKCGYEF
jgi:chromosome segregation ATPase